MNPLISVIIPTLNSSKHLKECFDSVVKQTYENIEVLVVDGGSIDSTKDIIEEYCVNKNWHSFYTKHGVSHQRNVGLDNAKGEFIYFLDSDDYLSENLFSDLYAMILKQNLDIVSSIIQKVYFKDGKIEKVDNGNPIIRNDIKKDNFFVDGYESYLGGPTKLYKREIIGDVRFDEKLALGEDLLFNYQIACNRGFRFNMSMNSFYYYRFAEDTGMTFYRRMTKSNYRFCSKLLKIIKSIKVKDLNYDGAYRILKSYNYLFIECYIDKRKFIPFCLWKSRIYIFNHSKERKRFYYIFPLFYRLKRKIERNKKNKNA